MTRKEARSATILTQALRVLFTTYTLSESTA